MDGPWSDVIGVYSGKDHVKPQRGGSQLQSRTRPQEKQNLHTVWTSSFQKTEKYESVLLKPLSL
jgi:hypothetical protein